MGLAGVVDLGTYGERLDVGPLRLLCAGTTDTGRCPPNCVADPGRDSPYGPNSELSQQKAAFV